MSALSKRRANQSQSEETIKVNRGRVDSIEIFEVKENELDALEHGASGDLLLNIAIALLSVSLSIVVTLNTAKFATPFVEQIVIILMVLGFLAGPILIVQWYRDRNTVRAVIKSIRGRINIVVPIEPPPPRLSRLIPDPMKTTPLPDDIPLESPQG